MFLGWRRQWDVSVGRLCQAVLRPHGIRVDVGDFSPFIPAARSTVRIPAARATAASSEAAWAMLKKQFRRKPPESC